MERLVRIFLLLSLVLLAVTLLVLVRECHRQREVNPPTAEKRTHPTVVL